jgi:hypothetical protein
VRKTEIETSQQSATNVHTKVPFLATNTRCNRSNERVQQDGSTTIRAFCTVYRNEKNFLRNRNKKGSFFARLKEQETSSFSKGGASRSQIYSIVSEEQNFSFFSKKAY